MSSSLLPALGSVDVTLAANEAIAVFSEGAFSVSQVTSAVNMAPSPPALLVDNAAGSAEYVSSAFSSGATIRIQAYGGVPVYYEKGTAPVVKRIRLVAPVQTDPVAVNATGAVSAAAILCGIVTSTTAGAVAGTIPTGTAMDAAATFAVGDSVDWSVINTGGNTFTVTAATDHTIVGNAAVVTVTTGRFRTRKTAANTFVTYRIG